MGTDIVIAFTPVGGGHKAAALALAEAARNDGLSVELVDTFEHTPRFIGDAYKTAHIAGQTAIPELYGSAYFAANRRGGSFEPVRRGFDHVVFAGLERRVRELAPRVVVATHHLPLVVLGRARRRGRLAALLVGVVTDYTSHACWAEAGVDAFCVPCLLAQKELAAHGVTLGRIVLTGIPVRREFFEIPLVRPHEGGSGASPERREPLRVLVTSGGFGVGPVREVVGSFAGVPDVKLTVVCGAAQGMVERVARKAARAGVDAEVVGFEPDMPRRMAEAHLVVGKAGGLTVSESLAAGRPMITVGTVPGNESSNERLVVEGGAGYASEPRAVGKLAAMMRDRGLIAAMGARARRLVLPDSAERVLAVATSLRSAACRPQVA
jgi:processive 1,2-diacylglycerol beta-glucosyltransferase